MSRSAARRAGAVIADGRGALLEVAHKGAIDMVTQIDLAAEAVIREELSAHTPDIPILAEEGGGAWSEDTRWIVDPLDGTTNFVHGYPSYAVSIALQVDGVLEAGCIFDAVGGVPYTAIRGGGAYRDGEPIAVSETPVLDRALLVTGFPMTAELRSIATCLMCVSSSSRARGFDVQAPRPWTSSPSPPDASTGTGSLGSIPGILPQGSCSFERREERSRTWREERWT